jgi:tetratricopeptide (TPR) repeat protein
VDALRLFGLCKLRLGHIGPALGLLARACAIAPANPWTRLHYGIGLQAAGQHQDAATLFRACLPQLPGDPAPSLNLASALLALGDTAGAISHARRARLRAPTLPQAHYTLGSAYLAAGLGHRAAAAFDKAISLAPDFADAWVNLGLVRYQDGDIGAATLAMRQALRADPDHAAATCNLGVLLRLMGRIEESEALLLAFAARHPQAASVRTNLAAALLQEGQAAQALALLDETGPPDAIALAQHWRLQRMLACIQLGRLADAEAEAAAIGTPLPGLASLLAWRQTLLANAKRDEAAAARHAEEMRLHLQAAETMLPEHRIMGHYDLAKFWSHKGQPGRAFPHWAAGHRLLARFQPFDRATAAAEIDAMIAGFTAQRLAAGARAGNRDSTPVFIVGMPRSGTTLAEQILAAHGQAHGAGERPALADIYAHLGGGGGPAAVQAILAHDAARLDTAAARYLSALHGLDPQAARIVDKMPSNYLRLGLIALLFPAAKIIACARDPRDIGLSIFTYRFYGAHPYAHDLADLGWMIGQHHRLMRHWRAVLPNPILTVNLADWVEDFPKTLDRVLGFLELPADPACARFYQSPRQVRTVSRNQVREPINARGIGRWRTYQRELTPMIEILSASGALDGHQT